MAPTCKRASICSTWLASRRAILASRADAAACKQEIVQQRDVNLYRIIIYSLSFIFHSFSRTNLILGHHNLCCWALLLHLSHKGNKKQIHQQFNILWATCICLLGIKNISFRGYFNRSVLILRPDGALLNSWPFKLQPPVPPLHYGYGYLMETHIANIILCQPL